MMPGMTTLPPSIAALDFGGRQMLAVVLLDTLGETPAGAASVRDGLGRVRLIDDLPADMRSVVDAAFHLAVWAALHPEQHHPIRQATSAHGPADDWASVLAAVPQEGRGPLGSLAEAATCMPPDDARRIERQLKFFADHLDTDDRVPAVLSELATLVKWSVLHPPKPGRE